MTDKLSPERRSWNMSRIKSRDTRPELIVRSILHRMGYRFRLHRRDLPGSPDIVLPAYKTVIFMHGCFWYRHRGCRETTMPRTRTGFWKQKFAANVKRDKMKTRELEKIGWHVQVVWGCETADPHGLASELRSRLSSVKRKFTLK